MANSYISFNCLNIAFDASLVVESLIVQLNNFTKIAFNLDFSTRLLRPSLSDIAYRLNKRRACASLHTYNAKYCPMPVLPVPVIAKYFCSAIARPDIARPDIARAHELTHIEQYLPERESETDFLFVSPSQLSLSSSLLKKKMKMKNEKWQLRFAVPAQ
eukprot:scaffold9851_cov214-Skeletonema_marinoi.AAC.3